MLMEYKGRIGGNFREEGAGGWGDMIIYKFATKLIDLFIT